MSMLIPGNNDRTQWAAPTLENGWVDYDTARPAKYRKVANMVELKGLIKSGTTTNGTTIATLPAGFRPGSPRYFIVASSGATTGSPAMLIISSAGVVQGFNLDATYTALDGVSFEALN